MARRTFTDADSELLLRLGNRSDATSALREQWLNDAHFKVGKQYEHREIQATENLSLLIATDSVAMPADIWWPDWLFNTTDSKPVHDGDRDLIETMTKRTAPPNRFYTWGTSFFFDTLADTGKTIRLYYIAKPARWSGTDNLPYDEVYDQIVMLWATKISLVALRDLEEADAIGKEIGMYVAQNKLPTREQKKNDQNTGIQVRFR